MRCVKSTFRSFGFCSYCFCLFAFCLFLSLSLRIIIRFKSTNYLATSPTSTPPDSTSLINGQPHRHKQFSTASNLSLFPQMPYPPLKSLKNPCWFEAPPKNLTEAYKNNPYIVEFRRYFEKVRYYRSKYDRNFKDKGHSPLTTTQRLRCAPFFFLAGVPKCGTTQLYELLMTHPDIFTGANKVGPSAHKSSDFKIWYDSSLVVKWPMRMISMIIWKPQVIQPPMFGLAESGHWDSIFWMVNLAFIEKKTFASLTRKPNGGLLGVLVHFIQQTTDRHIGENLQLCGIIWTFMTAPQIWFSMKSAPNRLLLPCLWMRHIRTR